MRRFGREIVKCRQMTNSVIFSASLASTIYFVKRKTSVRIAYMTFKRAKNYSRDNGLLTLYIPAVFGIDYIVKLPLSGGAST